LFLLNKFRLQPVWLWHICPLSCVVTSGDVLLCLSFSVLLFILLKFKQLPQTKHGQTLFNFHLYLHVDSSSFGLYHYVINLQYIFVRGKWSIVQKVYIIYFLFFQLQSVLAALIDWIWMSYNVSSPVLYYYLCDVLIFVLWSETTMKQYWRLYSHCQWWRHPLDTVDTEDTVSRDI